jgi:hypothetical protein
MNPFPPPLRGKLSEKFGKFSEKKDFQSIDESDNYGRFYSK